MPQAESPTLEVCVDTAGGLLVAQQHADRIELCSALALGGLTPSPGLMRLATDSAVPIHALIRPRAGDFNYSEADLMAAIADIQTACDLGLAGVVIGAAKDGRLDVAALDAMSHAAGTLELTLHRVIDTLADPITAVEDAIARGFTRILTSGGAPDAIAGLSRLAEMHRAAAGRISIMAGGGVNAGNVAQIAACGIRDFHASCSIRQAIETHHQRLGFGETLQKTDASRIKALRVAISSIPMRSPRSDTSA